VIDERPTATPTPDTETDQAAPPEPARPAAVRLLRKSSLALLALIACGAAGLIAMMLFGYGVAQVGPGGILSDVRVGREAPDFELAMLDGHTVKLSDYRGRPVALTFWTTWCQGCVFELPTLETAMQDHADADLVVLAVNVGEWPADVESWLEARDIELPVPLDATKRVHRLYRVVGLPTTVWLDGDGVIRAVHVGIMTPDEIDGYVERAVAGADGPG
jgi:peroxiredoxin